LLALDGIGGDGVGLYIVDACDLNLSEYVASEVDQHLYQLRENGLVDSPGSQPGSGGITFRALTWKGHDFLDCIRDPEAWRKARDVAEKSGGCSLDLLIEVAKELSRRKVESNMPVSIQQNALKMLNIIYERTKNRGDGIDLDDAAGEAGIYIEDAKAAWLYLVEKGLLGHSILQPSRGSVRVAWMQLKARKELPTGRHQPFPRRPTTR
jgi:DNA-binding transcriptional ArsR family regulator